VKTGALAAALLALLLGAAALWVRLAPSDPELWHVDPSTVTGRNPRNSYLLAPGGDAPAVQVAMPPDQTAERLASIALATPRTRVLAGQGTFVTYLTRSALWGFPDFTSVRILPSGDGSEVLVYARSRFGDGDAGVNRARVKRWLDTLQF
jgi:uncharacterized protein (DUF1499 family)